jgi:UDP-3-O-[3-hydroxymyristoyl] glucosamine N-acyltransferase
MDAAGGAMAPPAALAFGAVSVVTDARTIAALLGGELVGDGDTVIRRIGPLSGADDSTVSFLSNPRYTSQLENSAAGCVLVGSGLRGAIAGRRSSILLADPYLGFARLTQWWARQIRPSPQAGVHPSAVVSARAFVHPSASIGPQCFVGDGARIDAQVVLGPQCVVEAGAAVGEGSVLKARVTLGHGCQVGARAVIHAGVVIGADGFGFAPHEGRWEKIEQLGAVRIGDDVEIGANTCIDRGALDDTVLEDGVKLDNLIQVGHNVHIGAHSAMAGCVGIAGSARIGRHCTVGGGAIILGHLELADHVHVSAATVVSRSIRVPGQYSGVFPFDDNASWEKNAATLRQLHTLRDRVRALEKKTP